MKVIIKPVGLIVLLSAIVLLTVLAFRQTKTEPSPVVSSGRVVKNAEAPPPQELLSADGNLIASGDFEDGYISPAPDPVKTNVAKIKGTIAGNGLWFDNSAWADISAEYAPDETIFHGGKRSQRVDLEKVRFGHIQFAQIRVLPTDRDYEVSAWVRASKQTKVTLAMRVGEKSLLTTQDLSAGPEWRKVSVKTFRRRIAKGEDNNTWVMLFLREPGTTYWIDDVKVLPLNNAVAAK
ncbi:MAG: hypothetical protein H8F28_03200 [Fibrella sp.]|nr:hypothetical protein [Armatimonadota bacterium]